MSSLRRAHKSRQRIHRDRHQPESRQHLGFLEHKKDYKQRANDYQKKQNALKLLRKKVLDKNPEEFDFHMIRSQVRDGVHFEIRDDDKEFTADEMKLMQSQDINYIQRKRMIELQKIERLRQSLHLIDCEDKPKNKHTFFVDNESEKKGFSFAKRMKVDQKLLKLGFNIANSDKLNEQNIDESDVESIAYLRNKSYKELAKRMERLRFLDILYQKMDIKKKVVSKAKNERKPKKVAKGSATQPPQYKWKAERKK